MRRWLAVYAISLLLAAGHAQEPTKRTFDLPSALAARTFKLFSEQSGRALIADADLVRDVWTKPVKGEFTPGDAVTRMLAGTGFTAREDPKSGAFVIYRENPGPNGQRAAQMMASDRPTGRNPLSTPPKKP
jgi:hypothetical protein